MLRCERGAVCVKARVTCVWVLERSLEQKSRDYAVWSVCVTVWGGCAPPHARTRGAHCAVWYGINNAPPQPPARSHGTLGRTAHVPAPTPRTPRTPRTEPTARAADRAHTPLTPAGTAPHTVTG